MGSAARDRLADYATQAQDCLRLRELNNEDVDVNASDICDDIVTRDVQPFDLTGAATIEDGALRAFAAFEEQIGVGDRTRLSFGDFSINRDESGSTTASVSINLAWEKILDDRTLTGSTVGLDFSRTDVDAEMHGISNGISLSAGLYGARRFQREIYGYAFFDVGVAHNTLNVQDTEHFITGNFRSAFIEAGAAVSGELVRGDHTVVPEIEADIARIWLDGGDLRLTSESGSPVNLTENGFWYASLRFTPEYRFSMDRDLLGRDWSTFFVEPELGCEYLSALDANVDCGGGLGIGIYGRSRDAMTSYEVRIDGTRYGSRRTYGLALKFEHRF